MDDQPPKKKLLLLGATGYVGGTVLMTLLNSDHRPIKDLTITVLVQKKQEADALAKLRVTIVPFQGPDDIATLTTVASQHDIVVNTEAGFPRQSSLDLVGGLAGRKKTTGRDVIYIHTSGAYNLADAPPREEAMTRFSDILDDITEVVTTLNAQHPLPSRGSDLAILHTSNASSVKPLIMMPTDIYGIGTGPITKASHQIGKLTFDALKAGRPTMVGEGFGEVGHIHVEDLAAMYETVIFRLLDRWQVRSGMYFCSGGTHKWKNVANMIGRIGLDMGSLESSSPMELTQGEAARRWTGGNLGELRRTYCSRFETRPDKARALGWLPKKGEDDWGNWIRQSARSAFGAAKKQ